MDRDIIIYYIVAPLVAVVGALLLRHLLFGKAGTLTAPGLTVRRTKCLLCGPMGSGKTTIWQRLVTGATAKNTHTSMVPNVGTVRTENGSFELVDFPGHGRLKDDLAAHLPAAKVIVIVLDAVAATDEHVGTHNVASLLARLIEDKSVSAGASLVIAANKRDEDASYSAKAIRTMLEKELTTLFAARGAAIGKVAGAAGTKKAASKRSETGLIFEEGEQFTFEASCSVPVSFVDIAAVPHEKFSLQPIIDSMLR
jgi:signal recognition particle receptor subunit beta